MRGQPFIGSGPVGGRVGGGLRRGSSKDKQGKDESSQLPQALQEKRTPGLAVVVAWLPPIHHKCQGLLGYTSCLAGTA